MATWFHFAIEGLQPGPYGVQIGLDRARTGPEISTETGFARLWRLGISVAQSSDMHIKVEKPESRL